MQEKWKMYILQSEKSWQKFRKRDKFFPRGKFSADTHA